MCFSAEASFTASAVLIPAGVYCVSSAARKRPQWLPLAVAPLGFGIQQASEGVVWLGLDRSDPGLTRIAALVFLFFALAFWPFWVSFQAAVAEPNRTRRLVLNLMACVNSVWFWVLYYPMLVGPESLLHIEVVHHSIRYTYPALAVYQWVSQPVLRVLYLFTVAAPLGVASASWGKMPGLVLGGSAAIAALAFGYAFVSVWCFFAAALSVYLCIVLRSLPMTDPVPVASGTS